MARFNILPTLIALAAALILPAFNAQAEVRGGLYDVESKIPFNILDSVYYDAKSGQLALIGHRDNRFKGPAIPYLQHLATLLENPKPEFTLTWTPESNRRVDSLLARELTQKESDEQAARLGKFIDGTGMINHVGTLMLPALGIYPVNDNRAPGDLGVEVQSINGGRVVVMSVRPGSAADKAGLKPVDFIVSVRPDRPVFFSSEFKRQIRLAGAGAHVEVSYQRQGVLHSAHATLDAAADADPWRQVDRYDVLGMMYRKAGDAGAANVINMMGIVNSEVIEKEQKSGLEVYSALMQSLGMTADFKHLQQVAASGAPPYDDGYKYGLRLSQQLDAIFHFSGNPLQKFYIANVRQTHNPAGAAGLVLGNEFERHLTPKIGQLIDRLILRPGVGFLIPPDLVEEEYHIHPEMTPEYLGVPADSQLARLMLASDYLGKQLSNRQDLKGKIPGYQTQIEYQVKHPDLVHRSNTAYRVWISVAAINATQSASGKTLALRGARMRFNIRETDSRQRDLPNYRPGGYEDVLTGLYDQLEQDFSTLHELREAAKLAAVAVWMQKRDPAVHLPKEGRASWKGPDKVAGLVYIYLTRNLQNKSRIFKIAEGGVSLVPFPAGNRAVQFANDASVVDLQGNPAFATVLNWPDSSAVHMGQMGAGWSNYVASWVAPVGTGSQQQAAVVLTTYRSASAQADAAAKALSNAGCIFDGGGNCQTGTPLTFPQPGGGRGTAALSDAVKKAMRQTPDGQKLMNEELALRGEFAKADAKVAALKAKMNAADAATRGQLAVDVVNADTEKTKIAQKLYVAEIAVETKAKTFVLDPDPPKR
jgi:hypothetical protein